jgi:putative hydrolase of the HAD superfamily
VYFDFDDVLRNWDYEFDNLEENFGIPLEVFREIAFAKENVTPPVRGEITDEEWRANVALQLLVRYPDKDVAGAMVMWNGRTGELVPEVLEIVNECKAKMPVALFTNATTKLNHDLRLLGLNDLFDFVINASEIDSMKPEPEIYAHALKLVGIEAQEAFFADDRVNNIEIANQLGWVGHHFTGAEGLRTALVDAGVL